MDAKMGHRMAIPGSGHIIRSNTTAELGVGTAQAITDFVIKDSIDELFASQITARAAARKQNAFQPLLSRPSGARQA